MCIEGIEGSTRLRSGGTEQANARPVASSRSEGTQAAVETRLFSWQTGPQPHLGGESGTASPTALLLGALGGGAVVLVRDTLAPQLGVRVDSVQAEVRCKADRRGLVATTGAASGRQEIELNIRIRSPASERRVRELYRIWLQHCPVYLALTNPMAIRAKLTRITP